MNKDVHLLFDAYKTRKKTTNEGYFAKDYADEMERRGIGQKISKELPATHGKIHSLVKQDPREVYKDDENAEGICIEDLAKKHGVGLEEIQNELEMGIKVETEHTQDFDIATKIALDHLNEDPHYYTKLAQMEGNPENEEEREGDLMKHMKMQGMIPKDASVTMTPVSTHESFKKYMHRSEDEQRRLDPKCWKGYHKAGTKMKGGVRVNKCVKS